MIIVHHLENSRSQRVLWLLEEMGLEYTVKRYDRDRKTMLAPPELMAIHPLGKSPVITDGNLTIAESGAIIDYLVSRYDPEQRFRPKPDTQAWLDYNYWLHYAEGSLMPYMVMALLFSKIPRSPMPFFIKPIAKGLCKGVMENFVQPNLKTHLNFIETTLNKQQWFAGDEFSAADAQMSFPLEAGAARANVADKYPSIVAYLTRIHARPAYQRALAKGGPYDVMT